MFKDTKAFSSFSVDDVPAAKRFYGETLGVNVTDEMGDGLGLHLAGGHEVFVYPKENHEPASRESSSVCLPRQPRPAWRASSTSITGALSVNTR